jgi:hypothetical protein
MGRPVMARVAVGAGWVEERCAWCGRFPVYIPENEADLNVYCSTYCIRARALEDRNRQRKAEDDGRDDERRLPVHVKHPEMWHYMDELQRARPSYQAWRDRR